MADTLRKFLRSNNTFGTLYKAFLYFVSNFTWKRLYALFNGGVYWSLKESDHDEIRRLLKYNYYIILTRRNSALSTFLISLTSFWATGVASYYSHAVMNVEGDIDNHMDFQLIEATAKGVHWSTFLEVFDCDSVCVLKPKMVSADEWTHILDTVKQQHGKPYDTLFDLTENENLSCVELIYEGLRAIPYFQEKFPELVELINKNGNNLTPQMLRDCNDLEVVFEARR